MKKILFLFFIGFVLISCSQERDTKTLSGVYRDELHFTAEISNHSRAIISDTEGKMLLDIEYAKSGEATYNYISPLPVNTIKEFEDFFRGFLLEDKNEEVFLVIP